MKSPLDLHFDSPTIIRVTHVKASKRRIEDGTKGAEVGVFHIPKHTHDEAGKPVAEASLQREALLPIEDRAHGLAAHGLDPDRIWAEVGGA